MCLEAAFAFFIDFLRLKKCPKASFLAQFHVCRSHGLCSIKRAEKKIGGILASRSTMLSLFPFMKKAARLASSLAFFVCLFWAPACLLGQRGKAQKEALASAQSHFQAARKAFSDREFALCSEKLFAARASNGEANSDSLALQLNHLEAGMYIELGYFDRAERLLRSNYARSNELGNLYQAAKSMLSLDYMYGRKTNYVGKPDSFVREARRLFEEIGDTINLIAAIDNLGYHFFKNETVEKAISTAREALRWEDPRNPNSLYPNLWVNFGEYFIEKGQLDSAEMALKKALEYSKTSAALQAIWYEHCAVAQLGRVDLKKGRLAEGEQKLRKAIAFAQKSGENELLGNGFLALIELAAAQRDFEKAFLLQKEWQAAKDAIAEKNLAGQIERSQILLDIGLREKEHDNLLASLAAQRKLNQLIGFGMVLLIALAVALLYLYRQKKRFSERLAGEVEAQTAALRKTNADLERFAYSASHDLRTPLRNIVSFCDLAERRLRGLEDREPIEFLRYAKDYARSMNRLLHDIETYSAIGHAAPENVRPFSIDALVESVLSGLEGKILEKNASVEIVSRLPEVVADRSQLTMVFQNLIENALLFTNKSQPVIEIGASGRSANGMVQFFVRDNGPGIEKAYRQKVFELFARLEKLEKHRGSGLGLSICKKIVERHGGEIRLESELGKSTTVLFELPAARAEKWEPKKSIALEAA